MNTTPINILVVDDDDVDRERIRRMLSVPDINVEECSNVEETIALVKEKEYDCIIIDYCLGVTNGIKLLSQIRHSLNQTCAVIMVTGLGDEQIATQALKSGANDYLTKPDLKGSFLMRSVFNAIHEAQFNKQLDKLAHYDQLTGLVSRHLLMDRIQQAIEHRSRSAHPAALAFIDLDNFKPINDQYGHDVGDLVLKELALRLSNGLRTTDTVSRLGGDEFVILFFNVKDTEECQSLLSRLILKLNVPVGVNDSESVRVSASIGVCLIEDCELDAEEVLKKADQSMYRAKFEGKNKVEFFDDKNEQAKAKRVSIIKSLDKALKYNDLELYFQPKVDINTLEMVGAEALIRWDHPQQGVLVPESFSDVLNHSCTGVSIGQWVIEKAIEQWRAWFNHGKLVPISVNISPVQVINMDFVGYLKYILEENPQMKPEYLEIEIIESSTITNLQYASSILQKIKELGISIILDDFGTGHASLAYLKLLPLDYIKIDRSFIQNLTMDRHDSAIVYHVIQLADVFGYKVIAEGVETEAQLDTLLNFGCYAAQGYLFAEPMQSDQFINWVKQYDRRKLG